MQASGEVTIIAIDLLHLQAVQWGGNNFRFGMLFGVDLIPSDAPPPLLSVCLPLMLEHPHHRDWRGIVVDMGEKRRAINVSSTACNADRDAILSVICLDHVPHFAAHIATRFATHFRTPQIWQFHEEEEITSFQPHQFHDVRVEAAAADLEVQLLWG